MEELEVLLLIGVKLRSINLTPFVILIFRNFFGVISNSSILAESCFKLPFFSNIVSKGGKTFKGLIFFLLGDDDIDSHSSIKSNDLITYK